MLKKSLAHFRKLLSSSLDHPHGLNLAGGECDGVRDCCVHKQAGSPAIRDKAPSSPPSSLPPLEICLKVSCVRRWSLSWSVCLPGCCCLLGRKRESSHQEGTVGGEVPSLVLKVCIKGARSLAAPHTRRFMHGFSRLRKK